MASTSAVVPSAKWQVFPTIFVRRGRSVISFGQLNPIGLVLSAISDLLLELQYVETLSVEAISSDILHIRVSQISTIFEFYLMRESW